MSVGAAIVEAVLGIIEGAAKMGEAMDATERARLADALRANAVRLEGIEPNLPRIHALGEARRAEIAKAARDALALDAPTTDEER